MSPDKLIEDIAAAYQVPTRLLRGEAKEPGSYEEQVRRLSDLKNWQSIFAGECR